LTVTRSDFLFASDWHDKNQAITTDTTMTLLGDHFATDHNHVTSGTSQSSQLWGFGSCVRVNQRLTRTFECQWFMSCRVASC